MYLVPKYPNIKKSNEIYSTEYHISFIEEASLTQPITRNYKTTLIAKDICEHFDIVEEARKLIREGNFINWNDYSKSK